MTTATITVWLPDPGWVEAMGGLPEPMIADVWTGGEELPDSADEVEIVVIPFGVPGSRLAVLGKLPKLGLVQLMSAGALLVNAARGAIVDTGALLAELSSGRLRAALDVTDPEPLPPGHPLWSAPGLLLTPHVAGVSRQTIPRARAIVWDQLARYAAGQPLRNVVGQRGY